MALRLILRSTLLLSFIGLITACGGGGDTQQQSIENKNIVTINSDVGEVIGGGKSYEYTQLNAQIFRFGIGNKIQFIINGDERWTIDIALPNTVSKLQPGTYNNLNFPNYDPAAGFMLVSLWNVGTCADNSGIVTIDNVSYMLDELIEIDLHFEQHCNGTQPALRGKVHWTKSDATLPPGPVLPIPDNLWQPNVSAMPSTGTYLYVESDPSDINGNGKTYLYTHANSQFELGELNGSMVFIVKGDEYWHGDFRVMLGLSRIQPGFYGNLKDIYDINPAKGALSFDRLYSSNCINSNGWVVVDNVTYVNNVMTMIDLRFEQHCNGNTPASHGKLHWSISDTSLPAGPVTPVPAGLWAANINSVPNTGNYIYLESEPGDYIGAGNSYLYIPGQTYIVLGESLGSMGVDVDYWYGNFSVMYGHNQFEPGYYGNLKSNYSNPNPAYGGVTWYGQGRICNTSSGWMVVDNVSYLNGQITSIDLRFESRCDGYATALHGQIHWIF